MAGKLTRYGGSLGALRRSHSVSGPGGSHSVYFVCDRLPEEGSPEFSSPAFPDSADFPLPGRQATHYAYKVAKLPSRRTDSWARGSDVLSSPSREQGHLKTLQHFLTRGAAGPALSAEEALNDLPVPEPGLRSLEEMAAETGGRGLEAKAQAVPDILRADLLRLFPGQEVRTALTLVQRTAEDMAAWSGPMEAERDALTADFVALASRVVDELREAGFWADFIDPASGRPYLGPFTQATLFETDDSYRHFGFAVEDLGCCKVVSHPLWGTSIFVGSIFTSAPPSSPRVTSILQRANAATRLAAPKDTPDALS